MRVLQDIERIVPSLRRTAHALCAGADAEAQGDEIVREALRRALATRSPSDGVRLEVWLTALLVDVARAAAQRPGPGVTMPRAEPRGEALAERVSSALGGLPREFREALVVVSIARLSYAEAAAALGVSAPQLVSRLTAARDQFAAALSGRGFAGGKRAPTHLRVVK